MSYSLTPKQAKAKRFIAEHNARGSSPTLKEIAAAIGSPNKSKWFYIVRKLSERGHVMRFLTPSEAAANHPGHIVAIGGVQDGRVACGETGSRPTGQAASRLDATRFDPARGEG